MIRHLLRPLSYLSIDHKQKRIVDWVYPLVLAVLSTGLLFCLKRFGAIDLYSDAGLIGKILGFVQNLAGFYMVVLASVVAFNKPDIDKTMPKPAPKLTIMVQGQRVSIELTRRRFLCSMFAFLTAESLILIVIAIFGQSVYLPAKAIIPDQFHLSASAGYVLIFLFAFWQMLITTFWGLFYLGDRLHQPDQ